MRSFENKNGSITAASGTASTVELSCIGLGSTGLDIRGTFTATLVPEASINNVDFFTVDANPVGGGAAVNSITGAGAWTINTSGFSSVRVRCSAYTSGTAVANLVSTLDAGVNNNIEVSLGEQDIEIGAVELKDAATDSRASIEAANTARTTATKVIAVQGVDAAGAVLKTSAIETAIQIIDDWDNAASDGASVSGDVAHDSADAGEPIKVGGKGVTAVPTAVTANDRVNAQFDIYGKQVVVNSLREMKGNQITTITSSTSETTCVTADATYKLDVYGVFVTNTSATATEVHFKDATAGTTRFTLSVPANDMRGFCLPMDAGHVQAAANNNWTATCVDSVSAIIITVLFVKNL